MTDYRTIVAERLTANSPRGDHWNDWPEKLEIVKVTEMDMSNPVRAYDFGVYLGESFGEGKMRQVAKGRLPKTVVETLGKLNMLYDLVEVRFIMAPAKGQGDDIATRNLFALFNPSKRWTSEGYVFASPAWIVEIGCDHDYKTRQIGHSWTRTTCQKCGHWFEIDSSD